LSWNPTVWEILVAPAFEMPPAYPPQAKPHLNGKERHVKDNAGMFPWAVKERKRSYLLPGAGDRAYRHKQNVILTCSILIGLGVSLILAALMYWMNFAL
jgi:hypothetical protein